MTVRVGIVGMGLMGQAFISNMRKSDFYIQGFDIDPIGLKNLLSVLQDGACSSKTMAEKGPKMIDADFTKQSQIKMALKDSRLILEQGQQFGAPLLLTNIWSQLVQAAYEKGYAEKDSIAYIEILRGMAGLTERVGIDNEPFGKVD
jgi:3-hydroxyisobutyrate dehydrogenase-like beta-hydroxyacid dehydrogenase